MSPERPDDQLKVPDSLPVLPLRDLVVYPFIIVPLSVSRDRSIAAVDHALAGNRMILLCAQKEKDVDKPGTKDMYRIGTVAVIMRMLKLPDNRIRVLVQGVARARITEMSEGRTFLQASLEKIPEPPVEENLEQEALMRSVKKSLERSVSMGKSISTGPGRPERIR